MLAGRSSLQVTGALQSPCILLLLLFLPPAASETRRSQTALEVPHGGRQGRHLSVFSDILRRRADGTQPPEAPFHEGRAAQEDVLWCVSLILAHDAPTRRTAAVRALPAVVGGVSSNPVQVLA